METGECTNDDEETTGVLSGVIWGVRVSVPVFTLIFDAFLDKVFTFAPANILKVSKCTC